MKHGSLSMLIACTDLLCTNAVFVVNGTSGTQTKMAMNKPNDKWIRQRRAELSANTSTAEKTAYRNIVSLGYRPVKQYPVWTRRRIYFADLYIPSLRLIIEIDGGYHTTARQKRLDGNRSNGLWRLGYHVVRLTNHDARSISKIKAKILSIRRKIY